MLFRAKLHKYKVKMFVKHAQQEVRNLQQTCFFFCIFWLIFFLQSCTTFHIFLILHLTSPTIKATDKHFVYRILFCHQRSQFLPFALKSSCCMHSRKLPYSAKSPSRFDSQSVSAWKIYSPKFEMQWPYTLEAYYIRVYQRAARTDKQKLSNHGKNSSSLPRP